MKLSYWHFYAFMLLLSTQTSLCINIYADVHKIDSSTLVNSAWKDYFRSIIDGAVGFMGSAVTSRRISLSSEIDPYTRGWLCDGDYPRTNLEFPANVTIDYHFYIQFIPKNFSGSTRGYAKVCQRTTSGAPTIAIMEIDSKISIPQSSWSVARQALHRERDFHNVLHEMAHAFSVFSGLLSEWRDPSTGNHYVNPVEPSFEFNDGSTWSILKIPDITNFLKSFLNCSSATEDEVPGLPLFNSNEHVLTKVFPLESIVSGYSYSDKRFSELALRLIKATGFWNVNYNKAEPLSFGKNAGCDFINPPTSPNLYEGFCNSSASTKRCTFHRNHWGPCKSVASLYTEKVVYASENTWNWCWDGHTPDNNFEYFEVGSKCFEGSRSTPYCLRYSCIWLTDVDRYQIRLRSPNGTELARCNSEGDQETLSGTSETVHCPDPDTFCRGVGWKYCPRHCSGHGTCNTSTYTCSCDAGWGGIDCSQRDWYTFWGR